MNEKKISPEKRYSIQSPHPSWHCYDRHECFARDIVIGSYNVITALMFGPSPQVPVFETIKVWRTWEQHADAASDLAEINHGGICRSRQTQRSPLQPQPQPQKPHSKIRIRRFRMRKSYITGGYIQPPKKKTMPRRTRPLTNIYLSFYMAYLVRAKIYRPWRKQYCVTGLRPMRTKPQIPGQERNASVY